MVEGVGHGAAAHSMQSIHQANKAQQANPAGVDASGQPAAQQEDAGAAVASQQSLLDLLA